jgi:hypothetical protein
MEQEGRNHSYEEQMFEALSMSLYGRPMQNRCSILNRGKRELLENAVREMASSASRPGDMEEKEGE